MDWTTATFNRFSPIENGRRVGQPLELMGFRSIEPKDMFVNNQKWLFNGEKNVFKPAYIRRSCDKYYATLEIEPRRPHLKAHSFTVSAIRGYIRYYLQILILFMVHLASQHPSPALQSWLEAIPQQCNDRIDNDNVNLGMCIFSRENYARKRMRQYLYDENSIRII